MGSEQRRDKLRKSFFPFMQPLQNMGTPEVLASLAPHPQQSLHRFQVSSQSWYWGDVSECEGVFGAEKSVSTCWGN